MTDTNMSWNRAGLSLGLLFAAMHAAWLVLVAAGLAEPALNLMLEAHLVAFQYSALPFDPVTAILGVLGAFASGYVIGAAFAFLWNLSGNYL